MFALAHPNQETMMTNPDTTRHTAQRTGDKDRMMHAEDEGGSVFILGLKNAHAMENEALSIMRPQLKRIENYPEVSRKLEQHIAETENQKEQLEQILQDMGEDKSTLKDLGLAIAGSMTALSHSMAGDEILKSSFANYAFENFEIAAYKSLIAAAEAAGAVSAVPVLKQILEQERAMAQWLDQNIEQLTLEYISRREMGETAKH
jgi:ferritin-like metal-binding protein YciE